MTEVMGFSPPLFTWSRENFSWFSDRAFDLPKRAFPWFPTVVCLDAIHFRLYIANGTHPCLCYDPCLALTLEGRILMATNIVEACFHPTAKACGFSRSPSDKKAQEGKMTNLTGPQDPYEPPLNPELVVDTENEPAEVCAGRVGSIKNYRAYCIVIFL